ncbi:MAG TPA: HAMP domain-containing sensor histidine kinase [Steroidobacteraceae bacterium]|nr:HAMP domain-containing sensor histidine kinase [Steroidobacteraceae bacterium]
MMRKAGQGGLSEVPARRARLVVAVAASWLVLVLALATWWTTLIFRQAQRIAELEAQNGQSSGSVAEQWARTRLMLAGESSVFLLLLLGLSALLVWLYWRESLRARSMQAFFAGVTHELRTPLTSMRLQAEAIAEGDQRVELARRLLEDSHRLESQIDKTLELARIEGGGPLAEQEIPLRGWIERTVDTIAAAYGPQLSVQVSLDGEIAPIQADAAAVQMIFRNLIENSARHAGVDPVKIELHVSQSGPQVRVLYQDNGVGSSADPQRLGTLFGRGASSVGVGVGLYLVRALMRRMGGEVRFATMPGRGFAAHLSFLASAG